MLESSNERWATLVLVTAEGELLGQLPELRAGSPWWPESNRWCVPRVNHRGSAS